MKKIYIAFSGPIATAIDAILQAGNCLVVSSADEADETMCKDTRSALEHLLAGKKVILLQVDGRDTESVTALANNERFKTSLIVFRIKFTEEDSEVMGRLLAHCASE